MLKAIKEHCRSHCCAVGPGNDGAMDLWKNCTSTDCQLWPFRMGTNPFRKKREMTDEQRKEAGERMKNARNAAKANSYNPQ